jgi:transcriptional regulator with XRE-family HTH domain
MTSDNIGDALLARRKQRRLDQGRAATEIGVSPSTYRSYEKNTQRPSVNVFPSLAKFLGLEIEDFLPLYAATVIFALRPALEKELAGQSSLSNGEVAPSGEVERMAVSTPEEIDSAPEDWATNDSVTSDGNEDDEDEIEDDVEVEEEELADLSSSDEQFFSVSEQPATYQSFASEVVEAEPVDENDLVDESKDDEDEDDEDEDDEFEVEEVLVVEIDDERSMAKPDVSQFTSIPSNFQKSSEKKKKKKKNKKR